MNDGLEAHSKAHTHTHTSKLELSSSESLLPKQSLAVKSIAISEPERKQL